MTKPVFSIIGFHISWDLINLCPDTVYYMDIGNAFLPRFGCMIYIISCIFDETRTYIGDIICGIRKATIIRCTNSIITGNYCGLAKVQGFFISVKYLFEFSRLRSV